MKRPHPGFAQTPFPNPFPTVRKGDRISEFFSEFLDFYAFLPLSTVERGPGGEVLREELEQ
jgi:hypothetical protein